MTDLIRPALRYHGAKWKLGPWIIDHLPRHRIYVEPFGGSAAVLLRKPRSYSETYNDLDDAIVNLFRVLRDSDKCAKLKQQATLTPFSRTEYLEAKDGKSLCDIERARRLVVRSYMGFGSNSCNQSSGFRSCAKNKTACPASDWRRWPSRIDALHRRLQGVYIECDDYEKICRTKDTPLTLFYVDPPYVPDTRTSRHGYRYDFQEKDHVRLADILAELDGMVVLSGYQSELYETLFSSWKFITKDTYADGAKPRTETLWFNSQAWSALQSQPQTLFGGAGL